MGDQTAYFVRDHGGGIDARFHESIFGLFNKLDPRSEGAGIGLALVRRIVEFHGGAIWVESAGLDQGATFYFTLPGRKALSSGSEMPLTAKPKIMSGRSLNILLVEDNPDHAELVRRSLDQFPAASLMHHVEDGEAALDYLFGRGAYADRARYPAAGPGVAGFAPAAHGRLGSVAAGQKSSGIASPPIVVLTTSDAERDVAMAYRISCRTALSPSRWTVPACPV